MSAHLKEIVENTESFGWPAVKAYQTVWLQHLEQGRATWNDEATRLKLHRALVLHMMVPSSQPSATQLPHPRLPPKTPRHTGPFRLTSPPGDRAYVTYNQGLCTSNVAHPADLHVCSFILTYTIR